MESRPNDAAICLECVGCDSLRSLLDDHTEEVTCSVCGKKRLGVPVVVLAQLVDPLLRKYCEPGETNRVFRGSDDGAEYEQEGEPLVNLLEDELQIEYDVAEVLAKVLMASDPAWPPDGDEPFYSSDQNYVRRHISTLTYAEEWSEFSDQIRHGRRFFDDEARTRLARILGDKGSSDAEGLPVMEIGEGTPLPSIHRARRGETDADLRRILDNPQDELRPPLPEHTAPGRMNPVGIPVFYGACSRKTAIAEVRPSVGGVVVACAFQISGRLRLLDLSRIGVAFSGSLFAQEYEDRASRVQFLRNFHWLIARPISPNQQPLDYIPTQAVAEYAANVLGFDGILYASAQVGALSDEDYREHYVNVGALTSEELALHNVVIFGRAVWDRTISDDYASGPGSVAKLSLVEDTVEAAMVTSIAYRYQQHSPRDGDDFWVVPKF